MATTGVLFGFTASGCGSFVAVVVATGVLAGFPTALKSKTSFPFGVWFANSDTAYVADEGNGDTTFSAATSGP